MPLLRNVGLPGAVALLLILSVASAFEAPSALAIAVPTSFDHKHSRWHTLVKKHVRDGVVDYAGMKTGNNRAELEAYLGELAGVSKARYAAWTRHEQLAFWFNAYNAFTVKLVLENYPIKSIRKIGLFPGAAFRRKFIILAALGQGEHSLNDIEHGVLRKTFGEARLHFAVVCASKSCPALRNEAYVAAQLEAQLTDAAQTFLNDSSKNHFDSKTNTLHLSAIFSWFKEDFEKAAGSVQNFVKPFLDPGVAKSVNTSTRIKHLDYDWSLNGK